MTAEDQKRSPSALVSALQNPKMFLYVGIGVLLLFVILVFQACQPRQGTMMYGICRTFLEQMHAYPQTIRPSRIEQYPRAVRIYYSHTDPFGQYRLDMIECAFRQDDSGTHLHDILWNRESIGKDKVGKLDATIPAIIAAKPDLTLPPPVPDTLRGMKAGGG